MTLSLRRAGALVGLAALALLLAACAAPSGTPGASGAPVITPTPAGAIPLQPANPGANPVDLLAWLFTPIFQAFFIVLVVLDRLTGNIAIAIVLLTLILRLVLIPLYRRQLVSTRQMQLVQPEVRELQRKYKGDRLKAQEAVTRFYRERGINPASGCLPILLQLVLIIPMYSVISQGLTNYDVNGMLNVFGIQLLSLPCDAAPVVSSTGQVTNPCMNPVAFGIDWSIPEPQTTGLAIAGFGISILAIVSAVLQLVQSRMTLPPPDPATADDPNVRVQRQMAYFLPLISIFYGGILPTGLFLYWIFGTVFSIVQQYLIIGWGGTFPLFGWHPGFARNHTPRFPVTVPPPRPITDDKGEIVRSTPTDRAESAAKTIRPSQRRSAGRRGRRR
ncbi:MAG TPA: YidC/Oxa1 family membrane protein insertase [Candidatus Limnocylindrales bacterium]|nr:YidC/Oxa1 family membrane protein insertase [Candidatus Limnocylindrales bacterium]